jgi:hypothetical protein
MGHDITVFTGLSYLLSNIQRILAFTIVIQSPVRLSLLIRSS